MQNFSEKAVLAYIAMRMRASVPDLAKHLNIPTSTVVGIINRLTEKGFIRQGRPLQGQRGRPVVIYELKLPAQIIACQIGRTQLEAAIVDENLEIDLHQSLNISKITQLEGILEVLKSTISEIESKKGYTFKDLALAINTSQFDKNGITSSVSPWVTETVIDDIALFLKKNVKAVLQAQLFAEYQKLARPIPTSFVRFHIGDGVSAHTIVGTQMYRGISFMAGELGHIVVENDGRLCGCGKHGCLEAYASGPAIYSQILHDLNYGISSSLSYEVLESMSIRHAIEQLWTAWSTGDNYSRAFMERIFDYLSKGLSMVINLLDPEIVTLGGYVLDHKPEWIERIRQGTQRWVLNASIRKTKYLPCKADSRDELRYIGACFFYDTIIRSR